jgi:hypothetical protein
MATDLATVKEWLKQRVNEHEFREFLAASLLGSRMKSGLGQCIRR